MKITDEMVSAGVEASAFEVHPDVVRRILKEALDTVEPVGVGGDKAKDAFNHGYVLACCTVANLHDEPGIAFDVLQELGVSKENVDAMGLCEYDAAGLRKIEEARPSSVYRATLKGGEQ